MTQERSINFLIRRLKEFKQTLHQQQIDLSQSGLNCSRIPKWLKEVDEMIDVLVYLKETGGEIEGLYVQDEQGNFVKWNNK